MVGRPTVGSLRCAVAPCDQEHYGDKCRRRKDGDSKVWGLANNEKSEDEEEIINEEEANGCGCKGREVCSGVSGWWSSICKMLTVWVEIALMVATWIGQIQKIRLMVVEINHRGGGAERLRERGRAKAPE
ncbi:hypothetical protein JHK85_043489 [Glycine max]|nr:hypothetical protein JHK85_043489 [Glycine max]